MFGKLGSTPLPGLLKVTIMNIISGNDELSMTSMFWACFDHINEKWMVIWVAVLGKILV